MLPTDIRLTTSGREGDTVSRRAAPSDICACGYRAKSEVRALQISSRRTSSVNSCAPTCNVKQKIACLLCRGLCGLDFGSSCCLITAAAYMGTWARFFYKSAPL